MASKQSGFSTLADLLRAQGLEASPESSAEDASDEPTSDPGIDWSAKLTIRRERKGRGGKTVTIVSGLSGSPAALTELVRGWKKRLGRGARLEDGQVVVQGDCVAKLQELVAARGAKRVSISG